MKYAKSSGQFLNLGEKARRLIPNRLLIHMGSYSLGTAASQFVMMIYTILVARALEPTLFGQFSGSYALTGVTAFIINMGMDTMLLRERESLAAPRQWVGRVLRIKIGLGLLWVALLVPVAVSIRPDTFTPILMLVCALDIWFDGALTTLIAGMNIQGRYQSVARIIFLSRLGRLAGALIVILAGSISPVTFALSRLVATFGGFAVAAVVLAPDLRARNTPSSRQFLRMAVPFGLSELLTLVYMQADVSILIILAGSTAAGLYSPASGLVNALFVVPSTVFLITLPILSRRYNEDPGRLPDILLRLTIGFFGMGMALALVTAVTGGWILGNLLGPKYLVTSALVGWLSPLLLFKSLGFGWAAFIVAVGWQRNRLIPQAFCAVINVGLNLWAIPRLGIPGVALVYIATEFLLAVGYGLLVIKWLRERKHENRILADSRLE